VSKHVVGSSSCVLCAPTKQEASEQMLLINL
jgi:hypothetical protein